MCQGANFLFGFLPRRKRFQQICRECQQVQWCCAVAGGTMCCKQCCRFWLNVLKEGHRHVCRFCGFELVLDRFQIAIR